MARSRLQNSGLIAWLHLPKFMGADVMAVLSLTRSPFNHELVLNEGGDFTSKRSAKECKKRSKRAIVESLKTWRSVGNTSPWSK